MKSRIIARHFREAFRSLWRNGWMTLASISTVAISLLILGVFVLLALNVQHLSKFVESQVEIRTFLDMDTTRVQAQLLQNKIEKIPEVEEVKFIPREEGLEEFKKSFGEQADLFNGLEEDNPLPDSFIIKTYIPQETVKVAQMLEKMDKIEKVRYGRGIVEQLFDITAMVRNVGIILIVGLAFTAMFLIANTIKITIMARSREIEIMKLVGATNGFIRWPFFIEGALLGLFGAILPLGLLFGGYKYLIAQVPQMFIRLLPIEAISLQIISLLLGIGIFIGIWGTTTSVRKFLRV